VKSAATLLSPLNAGVMAAMSALVHSEPAGVGRSALKAAAVQMGCGVGLQVPFPLGDDDEGVADIVLAANNSVWKVHIVQHVQAL
jgi:hypothetical protein